MMFLDRIFNYAVYLLLAYAGLLLFIQAHASNAFDAISFFGLG